MSIKVGKKKKRICHVSEYNMLEYSELLEIQFNSFYSLFRAGANFKERCNERLYKLFNSLLPIVSHDGRYVWEFVDYEIKYPRYTYEECLKYGTTYSVPLIVKFRLIENILSSKKDINSYIVKDESEVYFGEIPYITDKCSFVINGSERVIVNHIHKTNGVFFFKSKYGGTLCETCNIIPVKGFWIDIVCTNGVLYAYVDQKKISLMIFLRALGYCCGKNVLVLLDIVDEIKINPHDLGDLIGRKLAIPVIKSYDETFCEDNNNTTVLHRKMILLGKETILDKENIIKIVDNDVKSVLVYKINTSPSAEIFIKTLNVDLVESDSDAVSRLYYLIKGSYAPTKQHALNTISYMFFNEAKYNLGVMGRFKLNKLFNENRDDNYLTIEDFINLTNHILQIVEGTLKSDDIDHLNNKNLDCVGDQLYDNIYIGLSRSLRMISERMNASQDVDMMISNLVNTSMLTSVVNSFFATNQLSQFMDNVNPLAEVVHKRRVSALGSGGVSKDSLATNIRDIHYSQYGRLCAIETPEGASIGLISSLAIHAKVHELGLLMTPYRVVKNGIVDFNNDNIVFLLANEDDHKMIAQACTECDANGKIIDELVKVRCSNDFLVIHRDKVEYMDISTNQPFSVSTALIPFVEHDDATRALMGSNMQRQAVPLLVSESPIVGTGMERKVAHEYKGLIFAEYDGVIKYVDARKIVVEYDFSEKETLISYEGNTREYSIRRMCGTNQNTCINYSPIVVLGQKVSKGEPLVRGFATDDGELALGRNLKVAFITWKGYNYEDAIVISERIVKNDIFTSMYVEGYTAFTYVTKLGPEIFTKDIQSLSEKAIKNLDENGLVMEGTVVHEGDVLVGKLTPKESSNLCPEEKLLRVLFGNKAYDFYDVSLYVPPFAHGVVIKSELFERSTGGITKKTIEKLRGEYNNQLKKFFDVALDKFTKLLDGYKSVGLKNINGDVILEPGVEFTKEILKNNILSYSHRYYGLENVLDKFTSLIGNYVSEGVYLATGETVVEKGVKFNRQIIRDKILSYDCDEQGNYSLKVLPNLLRYNWTDNEAINFKIGILKRQTLRQNLFNGLYEFDVLQNIVTSDWTDDPETNQLLNKLIKNTLYQHNLILNEYNKNHLTLINGDQLPNGVLKMAKIQVANKRKLSIGDKMSGRHGNKGIVSKILKEEDMPYLADGTPVDIVLTPLGVPSRMNLGQIYETLLGWAGYVLGEKYATPIFDGISLDEINRKLEEAGLPYCGEVQLYDGLTGEKFDQKSTVGFIYMLKLNHLVEDKVHARSIGQYTMITQQPLGGRVLLGGQRLGEMEVWALEAFGAAHVLQEMLTVKSDDIVGRSQTYEAIIKGGPFPKPGVPEAFKVLVSELRGLALSITFN